LEKELGYEKNSHIHGLIELILWKSIFTKSDLWFNANPIKIPKTFYTWIKKSENLCESTNTLNSQRNPQQKEQS
jgi:hypothetical protein